MAVVLGTTVHYCGNMELYNIITAIRYNLLYYAIANRLNLFELVTENY